MKNLFIALLLMVPTVIFSQNSNGSGLLQNKMPQTIENRPDLPVCMLCPVGSLFSNLPYLNFGAGISDDQRCFTCYDNFNNVSSPFNTIVFWGFDITYTYDYVGCIPDAAKEFEIVFYQNNAGAVGNPVATYLVTPLKEFCVTSSFYDNAPLFKYEVSLDAPVDLSEGWISIRAVGGTDDCWFAWDIASSGDQQMWQKCDDLFNYYALDLAFCLTNKDNTFTTIPLANWALMIGILLIAFITVFRFRKVS